MNNEGLCSGLMHSILRCANFYTAPIKTLWGNEMLMADIALDKDRTVSIYVHKADVDRCLETAKEAVKARYNSSLAKGETYMNNAVLIELAAQWERDAEELQVLDGASCATISNAVERGKRETKLECADSLRQLIDLLGGAKHG